jgi:peptidoglycan/xylan/chitin deacetylase (PgdA/CDA1 family)
VVSSFNPARGGIALTFDLCGGPKGSGFDAELLGFLRREGVRATIFVSGRWIEANPGLLETFAGDPLFEIANHGFRHRPCSATGREAYGIAGTASVAEMTDEIGENARLIARVTGRRPRHYRSGTAYTDEVCPRVAADLGQRVVNYTVLGDAGGTFRAEQVRDALLGAAPGSIVLLHLNRPQGQTAEGVREALPILKGRGVPFRTLEEALRGETSPPGTP